jgi:Ca2+-transporting ATPase
MPKVDWVEGVAICVAIIVVLVGSVNDWQKERQFKKLNAKRDDRTVKVLRGGNEMVINVQELVVGDIALSSPERSSPSTVCLSGVTVSGATNRAATGESDTIKKSTYEECLAERAKLGEGKTLKTDCFMLSGSKVLDGVGEYVVIAVGTTSFNGRIMMAMRTDTESTPLQLKLNHLAGLIAWFGGISGIFLFVAHDPLLRPAQGLKSPSDDTARNAKRQGQRVHQHSRHFIHPRGRRSARRPSPCSHPRIGLCYETHDGAKPPGPSARRVRDHGPRHGRVHGQDGYPYAKRHEHCRWLARRPRQVCAQHGREH